MVVERSIGNFWGLEVGLQGSETWNEQRFVLKLHDLPDGGWLVAHLGVATMWFLSRVTVIGYAVGLHCPYKEL